MFLLEKSHDVGNGYNIKIMRTEKEFSIKIVWSKSLDDVMTDCLWI